MKNKKLKKVFINGSRVRLFLVRNIYDNGWALVDSKGNYYANEKNPNEIIKHIDKFVQIGEYQLK